MEKARILIVDDNASLCRTMSLVLERKGYSVTIAGDGPEAVECVREQSFDVIFMDIKMPAMNGVEAYRKIKEIRSGSVVIMMTAHALEDLIREAVQEGAYRVMHKPLDMEKVLSLIREVLQDEDGALILVVDDDPGTCVNLKNILAARGYGVGIAHTGEQGVAMAGEEDHDIVFIDMKLPTINGLETFLAIREVNPNVVGIMMTAYREEAADLVQQALASDAYACLYKPINERELLSLVQDIVTGKHEAA